MPPAPREEGVTAAPLPPPESAPLLADDPDAPREDMVPNPLREPPVAGPGGRKPAGPVAPQGQPQRGGWVQMGIATLHVLDKINARGATLTVKVGESGRFGTLEIAVQGCFVRGPDRPADATALLAIEDKRVAKQAFHGWMVKSAPYMSMLAHPIYDVRVTGCAS